jgi:hypothetical protein
VTETETDGADGAPVSRESLVGTLSLFRLGRITGLSRTGAERLSNSRKPLSQALVYSR